MIPRALLLVAAALLAACGSESLSNTVKESYLKEVSRQGQLWIYDAENEIVVALDKLDEAKDALVATRRRIKEAQKAVEQAEKRSNRGAVEVAEAWLGFLESLEEWATENIEVNRLGVVVARAAVELAKAQVINREDLLGGKGFAMGDYQDQYTSLKAEADAMQKTVNDLRKRARKREHKWWSLRQRYVAQTGDYDSGLWTDY